ncbi:type IV secretion system protein, partial [Acinetobacter baumannii]
AAAAQALWQAAQALFFSTAGLFSMAMAISGVLAALGPVFIALLLFDATRGLFLGWLRALLLSAFVPMVGWPIVALTLSMVEPQLVILARE